MFFLCPPSVAGVSSVGFPAVGGPLLSVSRPLSSLPPFPHAACDHPLLDSAAAASLVGEDVVLGDGQVGGVGVESERAAAERERRRAAADGEGGAESRQPGAVLQLGGGLPADARTQCRARDNKQPQLGATAEERPRNQPHLLVAAVCKGQ